MLRWLDDIIFDYKNSTSRVRVKKNLVWLVSGYYHSRYIERVSKGDPRLLINDREFFFSKRKAKKRLIELQEEDWRES